MSDVTGSYDEGERVFGPPAGTYDADWVASVARRADPGLPADLARDLAGQAWAVLQAGTAPDGPAVARALLADNAQAGATACNVVARAAVDFVAAYDVELP